MVYSAEERGELLEGLADAIQQGTPLAEFARAAGVSRGTLYNWVNSDAELSAHIARARELGFDALAGECLDIADDCPATSEDVALAKMRVWTRLQLLARWSPQRYGDKQHITHAGDSKQPITIVTGVPQPESSADPDGGVDLSMFE